MSNSPNYPNKMPKMIGRLSLLIFGVLFSLLAFVDFANAATQWVNNPASCNITDPTNFPGQNCSPNRMCGDTSGIAQCYNTASLLPPAVSATSNTLYSASYPNGGYILNCYATSDAAAPFCDNSGAYWCNRSNTCYTTQLRDTTCTANTWGTATCGACRSGYADCDLDGGVCEVQYNVTAYPVGDNNVYGASCLVGDVRCMTGYYDCDASGVAAGNGCEALRSGACTTGGGLSGTWSCSVDAGGSCTNGASNYTCVCVPPKQYFETGTKAQYGTSDPLLWGVQFGSGRLIQFGNSSNEELFAVNNDGSVELAQIAAPATTTNKLYNIAGSLYWNGVMIGAGGSASGTAIWDTDLDTGIQTEENADEDMIRMDVGGMEAVLIQNTVSEPLLRVTGPVGGRVSLLTNVNDEYDAFEINTVDALGGFGGDINMILNPEEGFNVYYSSNVSNISLTGSAFQVGVNNHPGALYVSSDGYLGIGTQIPNTLLHVQGGANGSAVLTLDSDDGSANGVDAGVRINSDYANGSDAAYVTFNNNGVENAKFYGSPNGSGFIVTGDNNFSVNTNGSQRLIIMGDGSVGIDVPVASFPLQVGHNDSNITAYFQARNNSRGGVYVGNSAIFSLDEAGLYDVGSDYPLAVFDASNHLVHYSNHLTIAPDSPRASIGSNGIDDSAVLNLESSNAGFLMPRMTTLQRDGISSPSTALQIYNTSTTQFEYFDGVDWVALGGGVGGDNIYTADGSISANRNVTINDSNYLRFRDQQDDQNYLYFLTDYTTNSNLMIGGHNGSEGNRNHFIEFKDNLNLVSEGGIEINAASNQIDIYAANGLLQIGGANSFTDLRAAGSRQGLVYADDYSADFVDRSLVDKAYVDGVVGFGGAMTLQDVADFSIATDGSVFADFGAGIFEDDGGIARWTADVDGAEVQIGEDGGSSLRFQSAAGVGNPALIELRDTRGPGNAHGIEYAGDYSADFTDRSLVDKAYVDGVVGGGLNIYNSDGMLVDTRLVTITDGVELRFIDEFNANNYLALRTDYSSGGQLRLSGNNDSQGASGYIEFGDSLYVVANGVPVQVEGQQITLLGNNSNLTVGESNTFTDYRAAGSRHGLQYAFDYSSDFTARSLVDKAYVDSVVGGGAAVTEVLLTSATTDGSFSSSGYVGYEAANDMCENEYPGSFFCRTDEIIQFIRINGSTGFTGLTAWIAEGPPGYTSNSNDCNGWTDNLDTKLGAFWQFTNPGGGMGWLTNCAVSKPVACCR